MDRNDIDWRGFWPPPRRRSARTAPTTPARTATCWSIYIATGCTASSSTARRASGSPRRARSAGCGARRASTPSPAASRSSSAAPLHRDRGRGARARRDRRGRERRGHDAAAVLAARSLTRSSRSSRTSPARYPTFPSWSTTGRTGRASTLTRRWPTGSPTSTRWSRSRTDAERRAVLRHRPDRRRSRARVRPVHDARGPSSADRARRRRHDRRGSLLGADRPGVLGCPLARRP